MDFQRNKPMQQSFLNASEATRLDVTGKTVYSPEKKSVGQVQDTSEIFVYKGKDFS